MNRLSVVAVAVFFVMVILISSLYRVRVFENAIVFRLGSIVSVEKSPGLHWKMPFLDTVRKFDVRVRTLESSAPDRYITSEKKNILVETFVKWQIVDVAKFYVTVGGNPLRAETRLDQAINDALRAELGRHTVHDVIASQRFRIMETLRDRANEDAAQYGASVLDVRLKRVDLTSQVRESVFRRMEAERKRVANELRSEGFAIAERIRAEAERERTVILAEAQKKAQIIRGEGDEVAASVYNEAYGLAPDFYRFYRSLEAYRKSFLSGNNFFILAPDGGFFEYFKKP